MPTRLLIALLLLLCALPAAAQRIDTIRPNPNGAPFMRRIWMIKGAFNTQSEVGGGAGSVGDINGDGIGDFGVWSWKPFGWRVYLGDTAGPSTTPAWEHDSLGTVPAVHPIVGDFWGTGRRAVGFSRALLTEKSKTYYWLDIFRTESGFLADEPSLTWQSVLPGVLDTMLAVVEMHAADLDNDGDDELLIASHARRVEDEGDRHGEIRIYEGGPDFQVTTPSVIIFDPTINDTYRMEIGRIDADSFPDLFLTKKRFPPNAHECQIFWGRSDLREMAGPPDRIVPLDGAHGPMVTELADVDGDGVKDLIRGGVRIWRSGSRDARVRPFNWTDIDNVLVHPTGSLSINQGHGYINSRRYAMILVNPPGSVTLGLSGGPEGPDGTYESLYSGGGDGFNGSVRPFGSIGDVNGDGWDDVLFANYQYPDYPINDGIAIVVAGGPYIPNDDPVVGVRRLPIDKRAGALSIWPNPALTELNIAWRGDLERMPRRFEVYDARASRIAAGEVPEGAGSALWDCSAAPAGAYILTVFDQQGLVLARTRFLKVE